MRLYYPVLAITPFFKHEQVWVNFHTPTCLLVIGNHSPDLRVVSRDLMEIAILLNFFFFNMMEG